MSETIKQPGCGENIIRYGRLRLLSGDISSDEETVDTDLDLDDFQFRFQDHPTERGFKQIVINLSGAQWDEIKGLPLVVDRSPQPGRADIGNASNTDETQGCSYTPSSGGEGCGCFRCLDDRGSTARFLMILCRICGNKRCPHATDHRHACTGSNEPGQLGSRYGTPASNTPSEGEG